MVVDTPPATASTTPDNKTGHRFLTAIDRVLYPITLGYTVVILGFVIYEFLQGGRFQPRFPFSDVYLALLTAYAAQREGTKWLGADESTMRIRRGELFVGIWFAVYLAMVAIANLSPRWILPGELKTITLGVLGIFAVTGISSGVRERVSRSKANPAISSELSGRKEQVLQILRSCGPMSADGVAENLGVVPSTAWRILEGLEKEGSIKQDQSSDPRNRRYHLV